uniref:Uncharacterized protein n=1 Tax=Anolis carolinensis TaxID=28377 RepID=G1KMS8_ANOCA
RYSRTEVGLTLTRDYSPTLGTKGINMNFKASSHIVSPKGIHSTPPMHIIMIHNVHEEVLSEYKLQNCVYIVFYLFNNPLSLDPRYRLYVIYHIPSVTLLDRKEVTGKERESALHIYNHKKTLVLQSIGFGKRVDVPLLPKPRFRFPPIKVIPFENPEDAVRLRAMKRSLVEFSTVDWGKMPTYEERRLGSHPEKRLEKLTIRFR